MSEKILAVNFADGKYRRAQKWNTLSAKLIGGCSEVREFSPSEINADFFEKNRRILSVPRGCGLWLWKPYFILKALQELREGDYLIYTDSGAVFIKNICGLVSALKRSGGDIMLFENPTIEKCFTKRECFSLMGVDEKHSSSNQIQGGFILLRKSQKSEKFIEEWLECAQNPAHISSKHFCSEISEFPEYVAHREDQSILSLLSKKWRIIPFRDPSQYGDRPWEYAGKKHLVRFRKYGARDVPTTFLLCRKTHPLKMLFKESLKRLLYGIGVMSKEKYLKKYGIPRENILGDEL